VLLSIAAPARAQRFIEVGAGPSYTVTAPDGQTYAGGYNVRVSVGWPLSSRVIFRVDGFLSRFDVKTELNEPCPFTGCGPFISHSTGGEGGITANALLNIDPRGIFYVTGGTGLYDLYFGPERIRWGMSAGAGIAVPVGKSVRIFAEARDHVLLGGDSGPSKLIPVTLGVRW